MAPGNPVQFRATIKKAGGRPATDPGDKPVFEVLLKTTVSGPNLELMKSLGKDASVVIVPDVDPQQSLPFDEDNGRVTKVDAESTVIDTKTVIPPAGRRRNGTRSSEQVPPAERPDPREEPAADPA